MFDEAMPIRTERVRPRRPTRRGGTIWRDARPPTTSAPHVEVVTLEPDGADPSRLAEAWGRLRVWWDQTTFYLFSPDSWRR